MFPRRLDLKRRHVWAVVVIGALLLLACGFPAVFPFRWSGMGARETATAPAPSWGSTLPPGTATESLATALPTVAAMTPTPREGGAIPGGEPPSGEGLLPSLEAWTPWSQPGSHVAGRNRVSWVNDPLYERVAQLERAKGDNDGGGAGLTFQADLNVTPYAHLYIHVLGKILAERGGNIANVDPRWFPEGALQVRMRYQATDGKTYEWFHGFYNTTRGAPDGQHFTQEPKGEWFSWNSPDLMGLPHKPTRVLWVRVYGFGWEFKSQVASVELIGQEGNNAGESGGSGACVYVANGDEPVFFYPTDTSPRFGTVSKGMKVEVVAFSPDHTWIAFEPEVAQAANVGPFRLRWVPVTQSSWVEGQCQTVPVLVAPPADVCFVGGAPAKVYAKPSTQARVLGTLGPADYVAVLGRGTGSWLKVNLEEGHSSLRGQGWISLEDSGVSFQGAGPCENLPVVH